MGLYSERVGAFSVVTASPEERERVDSQLKILVRPLYSNPPIHGARIASIILGNPELNGEWLGEVKGEFRALFFFFERGERGEKVLRDFESWWGEGMADRIISMRDALYEGLVQRNTPGEWNHGSSLSPMPAPYPPFPSPSSSLPSLPANPLPFLNALPVRSQIGMFR